MMTNLFSLRHQRILITGSTGGLGLVFAKGLSALGATVLLHGRSQSKLDIAYNELCEQGFAPQKAPLFDVHDTLKVDEAIAVLEQSGPIDVLINNAGINRRAPLESVEDTLWEDVMNTNLTGPFKVSRAVARFMIPRKRGKIIHIASLMSEAARATTGPYTASKGGLKMLTKAMAAEWGRYNLQINAIAPGYFLTEMTQPLAENGAFDQWLKTRTPQGRWGNPEELVGPLAFLASSASDFVNGHMVVVDGGLLAQL